jgi:transcriptional regulator with XRE-family HTH domain
VTGDDLRELRKMLGCTARDLALTLDVDVGIVQAWERGELFATKRHVDAMRALAAAGPAGLRRVPAKRRRTEPKAPLSDPVFWAVVRKLLAHAALRDEVYALAERFPDPEGEPREPL